MGVVQDHRERKKSRGREKEIYFRETKRPKAETGEIFGNLLRIISDLSLLLTVSTPETQLKMKDLPLFCWFNDDLGVSRQCRTV